MTVSTSINGDDSQPWERSGDAPDDASMQAWHDVACMHHMCQLRAHGLEYHFALSLQQAVAFGRYSASEHGWHGACDFRVKDPPVTSSVGATVGGFGLVLEIVPLASGEPPAALLVAAYRASTFQAIALVLTGIAAHDVDRCLDDEVERDRRVAGVRYFTWNEPAAIARMLAASDVAVGTTPRFLSLAGLSSTCGA